MTVFHKLKELNLDVKSILDIGANVGDFSKKISLLYPDAYILMIEANPECESYLKQTKKDFLITALSDQIKEVNFYINPLNAICTGNSYYKENSISFKNPVIQKIQTNKLDLLVSRTFDFIKIDTQGSELDIMLGGINTLSKAKYVLLECSTIKDRVYNEGAPWEEDIIYFMSEQGFKKYHIIEEHEWNSSIDLISYKSGEVFQRDYLFIKENYD